MGFWGSDRICLSFRVIYIIGLRFFLFSSGIVTVNWEMRGKVFSLGSRSGCVYIGRYGRVYMYRYIIVF